MAEFVIFADSSVDLTPDWVEKYDLHIVSLRLFINEKEEDSARLETHAFYERLRNGEVASTSAPNLEDYLEPMEQVLQAGKDILYIGFSTGLSSSFQTGKLAMDELSEKYPDRKLYAVSSLCASTGHGLLVLLAAMKRESGASIEDVRDYVEETKLHLCHWFTVDDLMFLKRGGRISASTAIVGTMLNIKPVLHVDNEGHLINMSKARGRKASLNAVFDKAKETAIDPASQIMAICHGDCIGDAEYVANRLKTELGVREVVICPTGAVIGAHSGPGTLALFFIGTER